jgi:signal transduction histidine kinase
LLRLERLQRRVDRVDHQDDIDKVQSNLLHLSQLVVSLSQLIWLDRDQIVYEQQDLVPIIEQSVADCQLIYPDKQILTDLPEQYELATHAEYAQIVVRNILENACKYSPVRGEVNLQLVDDQLHISDQGCGISDHDKERVWLPFWQADSSREVDHGFWLWLALVRELSRKLGWEITFTNLEPHGTCFTIWLSGDVDTLSDRG